MVRPSETFSSIPELLGDLETISKSLLDSPIGSMALSQSMTSANCPPWRMLVTMSSTSMCVLAGRMMSEKRQSFSSHGCCATMHSTCGVRSAISVSLPPFQQVVRQGVSVHIMRMPRARPGSGNVHLLELVGDCCPRWRQCR